MSQAQFKMFPLTINPVIFKGETGKIKYCSKILLTMLAEKFHLAWCWPLHKILFPSALNQLFTFYNEKRVVDFTKLVCA